MKNLRRYLKGNYWKRFLSANLSILSLRLRRFVKKYYWVILVFLIVLMVGVTCYVIGKPALRINSDLLVSNGTVSVEEARSYYSILSSIYTIFFGFIGLILGFFYFHGRKRFDDQNRKLDRLRNLLDRVLSKMDFVNQRTLSLLLDCPDANSLKKTWIAEITSAIQEINLLIENNISILHISNEDLLDIARVHSTIDLDILSPDLSLLPEDTLRSLQQKYTYQMRQARMALYRKYQ